MTGEINPPREQAQTEDLAMSEFADCEGIIFGLLLLLQCTVEPKAQRLLKGIQSPKTVWETLKTAYCPRKVVHELLEKLMHMKYRENGNHRIFLQRFRELVQRLKTETTFPSWLKTLAFLRALSGSPSLHALMGQINTWKDVGASEFTKLSSNLKETAKPAENEPPALNTASERNIGELQTPKQARHLTHKPRDCTLRLHTLRSR